MANTVLITGGSRGIGLSFVEYYANKGWQVITTIRSQPSQGLQDLLNQYQNIETLECDVTDFKRYDTLAKRFQDDALDVLINNAGIMGEQGQKMGQYDPFNQQQVFLTNATAPMMIAQTVYPALLQGEKKVIANITSRMGSIADNTSGARYAYRSSKAALNAMMRSCQIDVADDGVKILLLHPGWVQTDMGGKDATLTPKESVQHMCKLIDKAHELPEIFYHFKGEPLPW